MASIGSFKKVGGEFQGEIVTRSVQTKNVRIVPETNRVNDNAPSHRVFVGRAEIGAAWSKRSTEGARHSRSSWTIRRSTLRFTPTSSTTRMARVIPSSGPAAAGRTETEPIPAATPRPDLRAGPSRFEWPYVRIPGQVGQAFRCDVGR
jgi:hypothetical protein